MSMLLAPFESVARWCQKLRALWAAGASGVGEQRHRAHDAFAAEPRPLAGKWPDQNDMMTRLTAAGGVVKMNGSQTSREADGKPRETRLHHEPFAHRGSGVRNVYRFPPIRS